MTLQLLPEFEVDIQRDRCVKCGICVKECSFGALEWDPEEGVLPDHRRCVACHRCVAQCPRTAIRVRRFPVEYASPNNWERQDLVRTWKQANVGGMMLAGGGNAQNYPVYWDRLLLDASQVTNPAIDPLREPMELRTFLGRKPERLEFFNNGGGMKLTTVMEPQLQLEIPVIFAGMSYGAVSLNVHKALARAAAGAGTLMNTGEGGLHRELKPYEDNLVIQVASGRFGIDPDYLDSGAAIEIKVGQGAKPGIGGHLPGEKVNASISETRMIPQGTDALSPSPHHDIYSIEDLRQLVYALKEATRYRKPVGVKVAAVHNVAAIASGIVRAGADFLTVDGFRGGTGATPQVSRDHVGIPIELGLAAVDERLREEGIRQQVSLVASGSIRSSADALKAIALGADAVSIGTAALVAMGCRLCQRCYSNRCAWGLCTQDPELAQRLDPEEGAQQLLNLLRAWGLEIKEILGSLGLNSVESLRGNRERLRGLDLDQTYLDILGVKPAGR